MGVSAGVVVDPEVRVRPGIPQPARTPSPCDQWPLHGLTTSTLAGEFGGQDADGQIKKIHPRLLIAAFIFPYEAALALFLKEC